MDASHVTGVEFDFALRDHVIHYIAHEVVRDIISFLFREIAIAGIYRRRQRAEFIQGITCRHAL